MSFTFSEMNGRANQGNSLEMVHQQKNSKSKSADLERKDLKSLLVRETSSKKKLLAAPDITFLSARSVKLGLPCLTHKEPILFGQMKD